MSKQLRIWLFALLGTLLTSTSLLAEGVITMTTSKTVGKTIKLKIEAYGSVSIDGVRESARTDGYEYYTLTSQTITIRGNVTKLDCSYNQLTSLDVSKNTALTRLWCFNNQLTSLDVSKNTALTVLACSNNQLTSFDVSKNTDLDMLDCSDNKLTSLNLSGCARLEMLFCASNYIKGKAMTKLVNSLPNRKGMSYGTIFPVKIPSGEMDKNRCSTADITTANRKNWKVRQ